LIYWQAFSWEAFASILTGIAAVSGAVYIGHRQMKIKEQELRLSLLEERRNLIKKFRTLASAWLQKAKLTDEEVEELKRLLFDIRLYFDNETYDKAYMFFDDSLFQNMEDRHAKMYRESGEIDKAHKSIKSSSEHVEAILKSVFETLKILEQKTRVGDKL